MALITCPECNREVSDKAYSCPHCGYVLSEQTSSATPPVHQPRPTRIGAQRRNVVSGSIWSVIGMLLIGLGILSCFVILPVGIVILVLGGIIYAKGTASSVGVHAVTCPYCGASGIMDSTAQSYKCRICSKKSVKKGEYLHPVL